jgi:hypothetical protein
METESKLINQGSYGCIYYPSLPFQIERDKKHPAKYGKKPSSSSSSGTANDDLCASRGEHNRSKYVSKLQKFNFHSDFEDHIGRKIQEIPSYELFFVPVLKTYKIDLATIKEKYVTGCDAISKYIRRKTRETHTKEHTQAHHTDEHPSSADRTHHITSEDYKVLNKNFIIQKMKYINGLYLHRYLLAVVNNDSASGSRDKVNITNSSSDSEASDDDYNPETASKAGLTKTLRKDERQIEKYRTQFKQEEKNTTSYHLLSNLFDLYERITDSIQLLIKYKIVHYDLKENNILVEKRHQLPYIIDFGLSIDISRLQEHPWSEKQEDNSKATIHSDILYQTQSSKIFQYNYLWRQHFYVNAPDYFLWPIEVHLMTYLINEHETLTPNALRKICYEYITNNKAIAYMSRDFKKKMFDTSVATFSKLIDKPREYVLNELLKYWDKWDIYAINIMFLKTLYEMLFHREVVGEVDDASTVDSVKNVQLENESDGTVSLNEDRQNILDPDSKYTEKNTHFHSKYKIKLKHKYNNQKIMNTIQVMLRNIHPNPDKRMTPEETKAFFVSIFYEC